MNTIAPTTGILIALTLAVPRPAAAQAAAGPLAASVRHTSVLLPRPHLPGFARALPNDTVPPPAETAVRARAKRPWWLFPAVGAAAGAAFVGIRASRNHEDGTVPVGTAVLAGASGGALIGALAEVVARGERRTPGP